MTSDDIAVFLGQCKSITAKRCWFHVGDCRVHYPTGIICKDAASYTFRGTIWDDVLDGVFVDGQYNVEVRPDVGLAKDVNQARAKYIAWVKPK